jgi:hypothetical protein
MSLNQCSPTRSAEKFKRMMEDDREMEKMMKRLIEGGHKYGFQPTEI